MFRLRYCTCLCLLCRLFYNISSATQSTRFVKTTVYTTKETYKNSKRQIRIQRAKANKSARLIKIQIFSMEFYSGDIPSLRATPKDRRSSAQVQTRLRSRSAYIPSFLVFFSSPEKSRNPVSFIVAA